MKTTLLALAAGLASLALARDAPPPAVDHHHAPYMRQRIQLFVARRL